MGPFDFAGILETADHAIEIGGPRNLEGLDHGQPEILQILGGLELAAQLPGAARGIDKIEVRPIQEW